MDISSIGGTNYAQQALTSLDQETKTTESFASVLENAQLSGNKTEIMQACKDFESYFMQIMFRQMRKTSMSLSEDSFLPVGRAEETFQDMLDEEYAKKAANTGGGIGLATFMYKQMTRGMSETQATAPAEDVPVVENNE